MKRSNSKTVSSPVKTPRNASKRPKVVVCSSSEGEDDDGDEDFEMKEAEEHESSDESEADENASDCEVVESPESTPQSTPKRGGKKKISVLNTGIRFLRLSVIALKKSDFCGKYIIKFEKKTKNFNFPENRKKKFEKI